MGSGCSWAHYAFMCAHGIQGSVGLSRHLTEPIDFLEMGLYLCKYNVLGMLGMPRVKLA